MERREAIVVVVEFQLHFLTSSLDLVVSSFQVIELVICICNQHMLITYHSKENLLKAVLPVQCGIPFCT